LNIKRKAPIAVLKSHTARVSKALFATGLPGKGKAYSCGFDSTVRTWDVESGVCVNTFVSLFFLVHCRIGPSKPT
jgi:ribosome biogenesis protein YTM1